MFLMNVNGLAYTCIYLFSFIVCYFVVLYINIERIFKQGSIWPIRIAQVIIALICAYLLALGITSLVEAF